MKTVEDAGAADRQRRQVLVCVQCRLPITTAGDRIAVHDRHEHICSNPHGYVFRIGCFGAAPGCAGSGAAQQYWSWFPGYSWQLVLCRRCHTHLGWLFRAAEHRFYGLILDRLRVADTDDS